MIISSYGYPVAKEEKSSTFMTSSSTSNSSSKLVVPVLDFSYLQQEKLKQAANSEHLDDLHLDNGSKSSSKMLVKQKSVNESSSNSNTIMSNLNAKSNTNVGKPARNEINLHQQQQQPHIKYEIENLLRDLKLYKNPNSGS